jgi:hypothetical protein
LPHCCALADDGEENDDASSGSGAEEESEAEGSDDADGAAGGGRRSGRGRRRKHSSSRRAETEIVTISKRTSKSSQQDHETLDGPVELPNMKPMMELEAGKNVWYQAYVLKESVNEAKVRFPREKGGNVPLVWEMEFGTADVLVVMTIATSSVAGQRGPASIMYEVGLVCALLLLFCRS